MPFGELVEKLTAVSTWGRGHGDCRDAGLVVHERIRQGGLLSVYRLTETLAGEFDIASEVKRSGRAAHDGATRKLVSAGRAYD